MQDSENEVQLFGCSAKQASLERRKLVRNIIEDALRGLMEKASTSEETVRMLLGHKALILEDILKDLEDPLKSLDSMDRKIMTVPGHVLLETDFIYSKGYSKETEQALDKEISELTQIYLENGVFASCLEVEEMKFKLVKPYIEDEVETNEKLKQCLKHFDLTDLLRLKNKAVCTLDQI